MDGASHKIYQTHLSKEFENQQQTNNRTKGKAQCDHNKKMDDSNSKHNQPNPLNQEKNVTKIVFTQMAQKIFIQQRI